METIIIPCLLVLIIVTNYLWFKCGYYKGRADKLREIQEFHGDIQ